MNDKFFDLKRDKQDRIINAALKVFAADSFRHASTDEIVKEAGISKGLLFHYFISKMGLYSFLFDYSVKYMLFEYSRVISGEETDYFVIRQQMEWAKLNVLRNYPYMNAFIETGLRENQIDVIEETEEAKNTYLEQMNAYLMKGQKGTLQGGMREDQLEALIRFTVSGLAREQFENNSYQPQLLHEQIQEYLELIRRIATR